MASIVSVTDFRNNIATYIDRVLYKNEEFMIKKGKSIVARVVKPVEKKEGKNKNAGLLSLAGIWKGKEGEKIEKILKEMDETSKQEVYRVRL